MNPSSVGVIVAAQVAAFGFGVEHCLGLAHVGASKAVNIGRKGEGGQHQNEAQGKGGEGQDFAHAWSVEQLWRDASEIGSKACDGARIQKGRWENQRPFRLVPQREGVGSRASSDTLPPPNCPG